MIKLQALEDFTLERYSELKNIERVSISIKGKLYKGDKFECEKELADYLLGNNPLKRPVVKIVAVAPEIANVTKINKDILSALTFEKNEKHIKKTRKKG